MITTPGKPETEKILIVEDEPALVETLTYTLQRQGYRVVSATDGRAALEVARREQPDLIVLDVMLPKLDGLEVCRTLRREMNTPIIMLTARDEEIDKVVGLEVGADDYLTKPFGMRELLARIKSLLRRVRLLREEMATTPPVTGEKLIAGNLTLDVARHEALMTGELLALTPKEFELLVYLVRNRGIALSRDQILEKVWGWEFTGDSRTVDVHIRWLREKIEADPDRPTRIVTVRSIGYRFEQ